ncbi:MAG: EamA family transporter [Moorellaceae bacterium]
MPPFLLLILSIVLGALAQVLFKLGVGHGGLGWGFPGLIAVLARPYILSGILLFAASFILWLRVLSTYELGYAYPMVSLSYVIVTLASHFFLGESLPPGRLLGLAFILLGIILLGRS